VSGVESGILEGEVYDLNIKAKNMRGEGIGMVNDTVVFVKNSKTRIGKIYRVRITKAYRTFAYAEPSDENSKYFIGNGSLIIG
jgi:predicted RNA-binding protein with TRAM domain